MTVTSIRRRVWLMENPYREFSWRENLSRINGLHEAEGVSRGA